MVVVSCACMNLYVDDMFKHGMVYVCVYTILVNFEICPKNVQNIFGVHRAFPVGGAPQTSM